MSASKFLLITLLSTLAIHATSAAEFNTAPARIVSLRAYPPAIRLESANDSQTFVLQATLENGLTRDVTQQATISVKGDPVATVRQGQVIPSANGQAELFAHIGDRKVSLPINVSHADLEKPIEFSRDVLPVLTKTGCSAGKCHGASRGKDGFHLSLFGYDPPGDYKRLTREFPGRRINIGTPDASLLLRKAIGDVVHTGGTLFERDSTYYDVVRQWIADGALPDPTERPRPIKLEIFPPELVLESGGDQHQLTVRVTYSDGTDRDVTNLASYLSNDDNAATVSPEGQIRSHRSGEAFVLARFEELNVGIPLIVREATHGSSNFSYSEWNYIDTLVNAKLQKLQITPADICDDNVFIRRVYIDLAGRLPSEDEYHAFAADTRHDRRQQLIRSLVNSPSFVELWTMQWADLLKIRSSNQASYKALIGFHEWLQERIANNTPLDETFRELLASSGGTFENPPTNFYQLETNTRQIAENVAQVFLGIRIQCAQCHNHPFDRWTMDDYHGFTGFFSQIGYKQSTDPRELVVFNQGSGQVYHPVDNRPMAPRFLGGETPDVSGRDYRAVLADWITSPDNEFFARNIANRLWAHHFGRGIVEPVDDVRISNPPSNPQLWRTLGQRLIEYDYDIRRLVTDICESRTYQLSTRHSAGKVGDEKYFARATVRRIRAEILLDCISQVTETEDKFARMPRGAKAVQIVDGAVSNYFLDTFGRPTRETVCACEVNVEPNLSQALHLLNGENTTEKIRQGNLIRPWVDAGTSTESIIHQLFARCYSRRPTEQELTRLVALVNERSDRVEALEDLFWSLLNSKEFIFNH